MSVTINDLLTIPEIAASDLLHILDTSNSNEDDKTTVDALADWIIANKSVRITGISDVPGLQAALDGKADIVHTHTVGQVIGLQTDLDDKLDVNAVQIIGRNIIVGANSINVPTALGGAQDDRIPSTVVIGEYLQFGATDGGINNITGDALKGNLALNLVDNTTDINKPISTATQTALDDKVDLTAYNTKQSAQDTIVGLLSNLVTTNSNAISLNTNKISFDSASSTKLAGIEAGADVTDTTNVWSSLGISGSGSTSQILSQRGVFVNATSFVSGIFSSDNTWTGVNTYTSQIEVSRIQGIGDSNTYLDIGTTDVISLTAGGGVASLELDGAGGSLELNANISVIEGDSIVALQHGTSDRILTANNVGVTFNGNFLDKDFVINKQTSGVALEYNAGTDTLTAGAANVVGFGGSDGGEADSIIRQAGGSTVDPMKVWTGTKAQYDALTPDADTLYSTTDESTAIISKAQVDTAIGSGTLDTDYYASDKTWKTIPSGGGVSLADDNDWTGIQTFSNTAGIQTETIVGATEMHISANGTEFLTYDDSPGIHGVQLNGELIDIISGSTGITLRNSTGNINSVSINSVGTIFNSFRNDSDFIVRKNAGVGNGFSFIAGDDRFQIDADNFTVTSSNITGVAGSETGTWTPVFRTTIPTPTSIVASYSKVGQTVTILGEITWTPSTDSSFVELDDASLPFSIANTTSDANFVSSGTFYNSTSQQPSGTIGSGVMASGTANWTFIDLDTQSELIFTDVKGYIGFTATYITSD